MTVRLRAHHLLCLPAYVGEGYGAAFVANLDAVVVRLRTEDARLVDGPDDVCAPLAGNADAHCHGPDAARRDRLASESLESLLGPRLPAGGPIVLDAATLGEMRAAFRRGDTRAACAGCAWFSLCGGVARDNFARARLRGRAAAALPG